MQINVRNLRNPIGNIANFNRPTDDLEIVMRGGTYELLSIILVSSAYKLNLLIKLLI